MKRMNKEEAKALFDKHSFLIGGRDVMLRQDVMDLLEISGKEEYKYTANLESGTDKGLYMVRDEAFEYITYNGFLSIVSNVNAVNVIEERSKRIKELGIVI